MDVLEYTWLPLHKLAQLSSTGQQQKALVLEPTLSAAVSDCSPNTPTHIHICAHTHAHTNRQGMDVLDYEWVPLHKLAQLSIGITTASKHKRQQQPYLARAKPRARRTRPKCGNQTHTHNIHTHTNRQGMDVLDYEWVPLHKLTQLSSTGQQQKPLEPTLSAAVSDCHIIDAMNAVLHQAVPCTCPNERA